MTEPVKVLIVDDSRDDARLIERHMRKHGLTVEVQRVDSAEGMRLGLTAESWDAVICDYRLPDFDPYSALDLLRELDLDLPVIVVSGYLPEEELIDLMRAGAHDVVVKDRLSRLVPAIKREIEEAEVRRQRKCAETQLLEAIESISEGFVLFDADDRLVVCNSKYREIYERSSYAIGPGARFEDIIRAGAERDEIPAAVGRVEEWVAERLERHRSLRSAPVEQELADGRWVLISERRTRDGGSVGIRTDVTAIKTAEDKLRKSEALLRLITDHLPVMIAYVDANQRYRLVNRTGALWYNRTEADIVGKTVSEVLGEADFEIIQQHLEQAAESELEMFDATVRYPDGITRDIQAIYAPDRDGKGNLRGLVTMAIDATERRAIETQLAQAQKMEAVGQLTGGVAHDFNNLLTVILGNARVLERVLERGLDGGKAVSSKNLHAIVEAARRGAALIQRLLAFSRKEKVEPRVVEGRGLVSGMLDMLRQVVGQGIEIETRFAKGPLNLFADPNLLEAAILNLASNARDAMPEGGTLRIALDKARLEQPSPDTALQSASGTCVVISVSDNGCGIPEENKAHIFEPFFTTKEIGKGSGLGLSMVFGFAKQSGGMVELESEVGRGTTFRLSLPAARSAAAAGCDSSEDAQADACARETILVAEDEPAVRAIAVAVLGDLGYRVIESENGPDALEKIEQQASIDLLFTDIVMPGGMNGLDLAARARERIPNLKVLYTTGYGNAMGAKEEAMPEGAEVLSKPYEAAELAEKIRRTFRPA